MIEFFDNQAWMQVGPKWVRIYGGSPTELVTLNVPDESVRFTDILDLVDWIRRPRFSIPAPPRTTEEREVERVKIVPRPENTYIIKDPVIVESQKNNDCGVVCIANLLQIQYSKARMLCFQFGWSSTRGIPDGMVQRIVEVEGFDSTYIPEFSKGRVGDLSLPEGTFFVNCPGHVMPVLNGKPMNIQSCQTSPVQEVYEMTLSSGH